MYGIHPIGGGAFAIYAPRGYDDLFGLVFRPNHPATVGPASRYALKSAERKAAYPRLTVIPWGVK